MQSALFEDRVPVRAARSPRPHSIATVRCEMVREGRLSCERRIGAPEDVAEVLVPWIGARDREHFVILCLDVKGKPVAAQIVSIGTLDSTLVHPREVFRAAILCNASCIIVGHNHPTGDTSPSPEDRGVTARLVEAGKVLGLDVQDHVIVGDSGAWTSLRREGQM